ncbi:MAG TPA: Sir2 family NAD-dependent protein deacetylase [Roseiflexaceae bacterium]|nr:Sir2 family NAD-dependent protein deacetylase [Roseiflexaceae bacterium]HMP40189.1 Sir2 family NAD-dependent protein deacetylase [Roseiflexaceae bacterium]
MTLTLPEKVMQRLIHAQRVVVLTGGGIASESGFLSFSEAQQGKWAVYDVSELATPQAFVRNPRLVWEWYDHRRRLSDQLKPSASHMALVQLEAYYPEFTLITQTIDSLHMRSGIHNLIEINGTLRRSRCFESGDIFEQWEDDGAVPPRCTHCGSPLRPDVVMFGEGLPQKDLRRAQRAIEQCDLLLCVGAIGAIEPIASFPFVARRVGAIVVSIAPEDSIYTLMADHVVATVPADVLPEIVAMITGTTNGLRADTV